MTNPTTPKEVTQAARDAAAALLDRLGGIQRFEKFGISFAEMDNAFCGAFARFEHQIRIAATERAARIAEQWRDENKAAAAKARKRERLHGIGGYESPQLADQLEGAAIECNAIATAIREDARHD